MLLRVQHRHQFNSIIYVCAFWTVRVDTSIICYTLYLQSNILISDDGSTNKCVCADSDTERTKHRVSDSLHMLCIVLEFKLTYLHHHHHQRICRTWLYIHNINKIAFAYSCTVAAHYCPEMCALPALHFTHVELLCLFHYTVYTRHQRFKEAYLHIECGTSDTTKTNRPTTTILGTYSNAHFIDVQRQHEHSVISIILMWRHDAACVCVLLCFPTSPATI